MASVSGTHTVSSKHTLCVMELRGSYLKHAARLRQRFYKLLLRILDLQDKTQQALDRQRRQLTESVLPPPSIERWRALVFLLYFIASPAV